MLISVLTPSRNYGQYVEQCLSSVESQGGPVEHIVQDCCSEDGTVSVLGQRAGTHLRWISEPDAGQIDALNRAFARATGDVVGWLNADEYYLPGAFAAVRAAFAAHPDADVVYGDHVIVDAEGRTIRLCAKHRFSPLVLRGYGCYVQSCATFIRRAAIERVGGWDAGLRRVMDWDLWLKLENDGARFAYVGEPLAAFRVHEAQVTADVAPVGHPEHVLLRRRHGLPSGPTRRMHRVVATALHGALKAVEGSYWREGRLPINTPGRR